MKQNKMFELLVTKYERSEILKRFTIQIFRIFRRIFKKFSQEIKLCTINMILIKHQYLEKQHRVQKSVVQTNYDMDIDKECINKDMNIDKERMNKNMDIDKEQVMRNACTMGHLEIINEYLKSHDINKFLYNEWTPLLYAVSSVQTEITEYLVNNGADVNKHKNGYTPLMALCNSLEGTTEQRIKCLKILIKAGANVNAINKRRQTPLMFACILQEPKFIKELIKYVKNIDTYDSKHQTALMYATIANKPEIVKILIENAADITLTDFNNLTINDIASAKGYDKILSLLNCNEEEIVDTYEISKIHDWKDMYPSLTNISDQTIDFDIFSILYGMNLEKYINIFQGMNLKTFLILTENDLCHLGMDINAHRIQFLEHLHLFHRKNWSIQSIGAITDSYTLYNGILTLGVVTKQIAIIGSSFQYITNNLLKSNNENVHLTEEEISNYEEKLKKMKDTLNILEKELIQVKALSKKIQKENDIGVPATYIGSGRYKINWPMFLSITLIVGICMSKTICSRY